MRTLLRDTALRLLSVMRGGASARERDEEIAFHEAMLREDAQRLGLNERETRAFLRRRFGISPT